MLKKHDVPFLGRDDVFIIPTLDGSDTLFSKAFGASYHSLNGAVSESRHVFIQYGLQTQSQKTKISILEFGYGTGLNAFLAFLYSIKHQKEISYTGIEAFPIDSLVAGQLNYPSYLAATQYHEIFNRMHTENSFSHGQFHFNKIQWMSDLKSSELWDCIFFDAFSPDIQSEQWQQNIFDRLFELTSVDGCLVTYCAKGEIRRRMQRAGYHVSRLDGAPGKREMLQAIKK